MRETSVPYRKRLLLDVACLLDNVRRHGIATLIATHIAGIILGSPNHGATCIEVGYDVRLVPVTQVVIVTATHYITQVWVLFHLETTCGMNGIDTD